MKRRTLDFIFVGGGLLIALLLGILGMVLQKNADFAKSYVKDQMSEQEIFFTESGKLVTNDAWRATLTEEFGGDTAKVDEFIKAYGLKAEADSDCLTKYGAPAEKADRLMTTGKQAECYANEYIRLHLRDGSIVDGQSYTYASIGALQGQLRTAAADAKKAVETAQAAVDTATAANDPNLAQLQVVLDKANADSKAASDKLTAVNAERDTLFRGETLRGVLLTSYGFSVFGEKAQQAAMVAFALAIVLLLASIAGLIHALTTPKEKLVGHHDETPAAPATA